MSSPESILFCGNMEVEYFDHNHINQHHSEAKLFKIELSHYDGIVNLLLQKHLTFQEVQRAQKYVHIKDRNRFIICRSLIKYLLAKEIGVDISLVRLEEHPDGKPYFPLDRTLFFNLAHAGDCAVVAIGKCELGVDIEWINRDFEYRDMLSTVFNQTEIEHIQDSKDQCHSFYKLWTRKEAIVKAIGRGIDDDLYKIHVTDGFHSIASSLLSGFKNVNVNSFDLSDDYVGALAFTESMPDHFNVTWRRLPSPEELAYSTN